MEEEGVGGKDWISKLPEPLIRHILSLVPTKCAASTTILSKGWNNIWTSVPVLDFREWKSPPTRTSTRRFMNFVDRVLSIRDKFEIKKFCLTCDGEYFDDQRIKAWITTAIQCRVEELIVRRKPHHANEVDIIPVGLYTCESLTLLDINISGKQLNLPQLISFPRLKILRLSEVSVFRERNLQQLFSKCPVLEEVCLEYCLLNHLDIVSRTLKSLTFVGTLSACMPNIRIRIAAPNLLSFTIDDGITEHFVVKKFPSLVYADIHGMYDEPSVPIDVIPKFVTNLSNVKHLKLSGKISESLELTDVLSTTFPTFTNLTTLEVSLINTRQVKSLFGFLRFTPNLESLVFGSVCCVNVNGDALTLDVVPHCLLVHLKSIKFRYFEGQRQELDMVQQFLQNARVLQTLTIEHSFVNSKKKTLTTKDVENLNEKIMEQLLKYKWASTDCVINLPGSSYSSEDQ